MDDLALLQRRFLDYVLKRDPRIKDKVVGEGKANATVRLDVYYNAYRYRIQDILMMDFEKLHTLVGDDMFEELSEAYIEQIPSTHYNARYITEHFPTFVKDYDQSQQPSVFYEMAAFEWALGETIDDADATSLTIEALQQLPAENWPELTLKMIPSFKLMDFYWDVPAIWQAIHNEEPPREPQQAATAATWALWRDPHTLQSHFSSLDPDETIVLQQFAQNKNFANVCEALLETTTEHEVGTKAVGILQKWLNCGIFAA